MLDLESASVSELALATSGLRQNVLAVVAGHHGLSVTEDNRGAIAALASHVHEVRVWCLDEALELVPLLFIFVLGVEEICLHCCGEIYWLLN